MSQAKKKKQKPWNVCLFYQFIYEANLAFLIILQCLFWQGLSVSVLADDHIKSMFILNRIYSFIR